MTFNPIPQMQGDAFVPMAEARRFSRLEEDQLRELADAGVLVTRRDSRNYRQFSLKSLMLYMQQTYVDGRLKEVKARERHVRRTRKEARP